MSTVPGQSIIMRGIALPYVCYASGGGPPSPGGGQISEGELQLAVPFAEAPGYRCRRPFVSLLPFATAFPQI
jgi:hypothetical protein